MARKLFAAVAAGLFLASGSAMAQSVLRIGLNDDPDMLDPAPSRAYVARLVLTATCDKLFDVTPDLKIIPQLATGYELSGDGLILTLKLRANVKYSDGEPFDAESVKFNLERSMTLPASFRKAELTSIKSMEVVDPLTLRINLNEPMSPLIATISDRAGTMMSPKAAKELGDRLGTKPVCAGPYTFVERVPQGRIVFQKNPNYWNAANVHIDRLEFHPILDSTVRLSNLAAGQLDMIERVSPSDLKQIRANSKLKVVGAPDIGYAYMQLNVANGPRSKTFSDPRIREALDLALDRETMVKVVFDSEYIAGNQWVAPSSEYFNKSLPVPKADIARAKKLLAEAGQPNLSFSLIVPPERDRQEMAQVFQAMAAEAGITIKIDTQENVAMLAAGIKGEFEAYLSFWSGRVDPDGNIYTFFTCKGSQNPSAYCNPAVDKLLDHARTVTDVAARKKDYDEAAAIWLKDRPLLSLFYRNVFIAHSTRVQGFTPHPDGIIRVTGLKLAP